jgi:hypothetical protein
MKPSEVLVTGGTGTLGLRRLMCNELYKQVRQVAQRSAEGVVNPLSAGVCRNLGRQARQQPSQRLGAVALQTEEVLELADVTPSMIWRLPEAQRLFGLRPRSAGIVLGGGRNQRSVDLHPKALPLYPREALVCQVGSVALGSQEGLAYGSIVGGCRCQAEGRDHPLGVNHQSHLEAVDPLGLGGAPPEGSLSAEKSPLREALTLTIAGTRVVSITR